VSIETPDTCRLCRTPLAEPPIVGAHVYGGRSNQRFFACTACGVAFQHPPLDPEEEARFYRMEFEKFMHARTGADFDWSGPERHVAANGVTFDRRWPFLAPHVRPGARVLEIGCSSGFMLYPLRERGAQVFGVDPSDVFTEYVRTQGVPVYRTLDELRAAETEPFDLIMHFFVLEHVRDPEAFLAEQLAMLKPGGRIVLEVPSREDALATLYDIPAFQQFYWSVAHHWYFERQSLEWVLSRLAAPFELAPVQRYDLSNHLVWALEGRPGGQGRFNSVFSPALNEQYRASLCASGHPDAYFATIRRPVAS
jgi:SAM-dependent methyltransferase